MPDTISATTDEDTDKVARLLDEGPLGMGAAARLFGTFREGKPVHPSTIARWAINGVKLANGAVVKLETFQLGRRLCTSKAALVRFLRAQQVPAVAQANPTMTPTMIGRPALSKKAKDATASLDAEFGPRKSA